MSRRLSAAAVLAGALICAPAAAADTAVVGATVFTGATGPAASETVALSTLDGCPAYSGPDALTVYPGGSTDTLPAGSTWTLAEILQCGLQIPLSDLEAVQVLRPDGAAQAPLTAGELTDSTDYADPAAPGALPVVSNDGGQAQNTYTRPWRGGQDENGRDQVTDSGPVQLLVYENAAPLTVQISAHSVRRGTRRERVSLNATVQTAAGTVVPATALDWQWTVSTGASSSAPSPTVTVPQGTATVTVVVSEQAAGTGGTASLALTYKPVRSRTSQTGGGGHGTVHSTSGLGATHHHHPSSGGGGHAGTGTSGTSTTTTTTSTSSTSSSQAPPATATSPAAAGSVTTSTTTTTAATTSTATSTRTTASSTSSTTPARSSSHRAPAHHPSTHRAGTVVQGQLLADVVPLSAAKSPLTHALGASASASVASPAPSTRLTVPAAVIGGLIVLALLGLGAAGEQRRRSPRLHR